MVYLTFFFSAGALAGNEQLRYGNETYIGILKLMYHISTHERGKM